MYKVHQCTYPRICYNYYWLWGGEENGKIMKVYRNCTLQIQIMHLEVGRAWT
jgi:hypothetical protein